MIERRHEITKFSDGSIGEATSIPGVVEVQIVGSFIDDIVEVDETDVQIILGARAEGDTKKIRQAERAVLRRGRRFDRPAKFNEHRNL